MGNKKTEAEKRRRKRRRMGLPAGAPMPSQKHQRQADAAVAAGHYFMDDLACPACCTDSSVGCVHAFREHP